MGESAPEPKPLTGWRPVGRLWLHGPCPPMSMPISSEPEGALPQPDRPILTPWGYLKKIQEDRFRRQREELTDYLTVATPIALRIDRLYGEWREAVSEPIQDCQKVANLSAVCWWQISDRLRAFERLDSPGVAKRYHRLFADALRNASQGMEVTKNGFRFNKYSEVSRGMGFLDRYLELIAEAEAEMGRLLKKYRILDDPEGGRSGRA